MEQNPRDRNARFRGRRVYLTGGAGGIGLATARLMAREGAALVIVDIDAERVNAAARELGCRAIVLDLADGDAIDLSVATAAKHLGGLDCVVNVAGVPEGRGLAELDPAIWDRVMAINLNAPYRICRAALPYLTAQEGSAIVNVASGEALLPSAAGTPAYAASKGGLISFTKSLAAGLAPKVRANAVCPGLTDTPMVAPYLHGPGTEQLAEGFKARYSMKRAADPSEIADVIAFLASDEASFVTGSTVVVDGGRAFH